jgi:hypothetical protein
MSIKTPSGSVSGEDLTLLENQIGDLLSIKKDESDV